MSNNKRKNFHVWNLAVFMLLILSTTIGMADEIKLSRYRHPLPKYLFVGEIHGTVQSPAVFLELIKEYVQAGQAIVIGLEIPRSEEPAINDFLEAGDARSEKEMLSGKFWNPQIESYDGRASQAMLDLLRGVRQLKSEHKSRRIYVIGFSSKSDEEAAAYIKSVLDQFKDACFLSLSGNVHAMKQPFWLNKNLKPMPVYFPADETFTINIVPRSGNTWSCYALGKCGITPIVKPLNIAECSGDCFSLLGNGKDFDATYAIAEASASLKANAD